MLILFYFEKMEVISVW